MVRAVTVVEAAVRTVAKRVTLAALVVAASLSFAGCAPAATSTGTTQTEEGSGAMELDVAQSDLVDLLDRVQAVIGGEWEPLLSGAMPCSADGAPGAQVSQKRGGPPIAEGTERQVADELLAVFAEAGYELTTRESTSTNGHLIIEGQYPPDGKDDRGVLYQFGISANGSSMLGYSTCVPGDPNAINRERLESTED